MQPTLRAEAMSSIPLSSAVLYNKGEPECVLPIPSKSELGSPDVEINNLKSSAVLIYKSILRPTGALGLRPMFSLLVVARRKRNLLCGETPHRYFVYDAYFSLAEYAYVCGRAVRRPQESM